MFKSMKLSLLALVLGIAACGDKTTSPSQGQAAGGNGGNTVNALGSSAAGYADALEWVNNYGPVSLKYRGWTSGKSQRQVVSAFKTLGACDALAFGFETAECCGECPNTKQLGTGAYAYSFVSNPKHFEIVEQRNGYSACAASIPNTMDQIQLEAINAVVSVSQKDWKFHSFAGHMRANERISSISKSADECGHPIWILEKERCTETTNPCNKCEKNRACEVVEVLTIMQTSEGPCPTFEATLGRPEKGCK